MIKSNTLSSDMGKRLAVIRADQRLTQVQMAAALDISQASYNTYENGSREMRSGTVAALWLNYGVSIVWMLTGSGPRYEVSRLPDFLKLRDIVTAFYERRNGVYDDDRVVKSVQYLLDYQYKYAEMPEPLMTAYLESTL